MLLLVAFRIVDTLSPEDAAVRSNDRNGEVDLPQMMAVECPHWAAL
nr:hypothetical protein [uncultured Cohaesibacter sp.]